MPDPELDPVPNPEPDPDQHLRYVCWWAHDSAAETRAFVEFIDWLFQRLQQYPNMHVYHYGAYEVSVLKRLAGRSGLRENEVDELLRRGVMVDIYTVVRRNLLLGEPRYSIKNLEKIYRANSAGDGGGGGSNDGDGGGGGDGCGGGGGGGGGGRNTAVTKGDQSIVVYQQWLESVDRDNHGQGDHNTSQSLADLREYNKDDCDSTREAVEWLRAIANGRGGDGGDNNAQSSDPLRDYRDAPNSAGGKLVKESAEGDREGLGAMDGDVEGSIDHEPLVNEVDVLVRAMREDDLWAGVASVPQHAREVAAAALEYERREAKPMWWRRFEWLDSTKDELVGQPDVLAGLEQTDAEPYKRSPRKRRLVHEYKFDPRQPCKAVESTDYIVVPHQDLGGWGGSSGSGDDRDAGLDGDGPNPNPRVHAVSIDVAEGVALIEGGVNPPLPGTMSLVPDQFVNPEPMPTAVMETVRGWVRGAVNSKGGHEGGDDADDGAQEEGDVDSLSRSSVFSILAREPPRLRGPRGEAAPATSALWAPLYSLVRSLTRPR